MKRSIRCLPIAISLVLLGTAQTRDLLEEGGQAFNSGDYPQAIKLFERARVVSANCKIPFYLGLSRYRLQLLDGAIVDLASAAKCDSQSIEFNTALAEAYSAKGDDNRALTAFETVLKLDPGNTPALRSASILYLRHDMSDKALEVLQKLVALDKNDAGAAADLAAAYAAHNQFTEAEHFFGQALALEPQNVSAMVGLGNVDFKTERCEQAVDVLSRAIRLDRQAYEPFVLRARAYTRLKRYADALADFQTAIQLNARDPEIHYYLSQTYRLMGREDDSQRALAEFKRLRDESNRNLESQRDAARNATDARRLVDAGDLPGAIALLEKARDLDQNNAPVLFRVAGLYFENHQYDRAQASIRDAIKLAPSQWDYYYLQGLIEKGVGQFGAARESLETAVRLNPSVAEAHNQLGDLAMRHNDFTTAVQEFSRAVQLAPQEATYRSNLENARRLAHVPSGKDPLTNLPLGARTPY
ncbi:MAG: tetratricopeptide repeat protein [Acidobacteriota bacterium]|nr:tetratricopeptide repeat protein [Acidobacteriota bacterium]MDQ2844509.1 tetratricopeptide repeat protein [Acidobacteriota bacterium]